MSLTVKDPEAHRLAPAIAKAIGQGMTVKQCAFLC